MRAKFHIAPPAVKARVLLGRGVIDHGHRLNEQDPVQPVGVKRLKQRGFERQDADRVGAGAFGEKAEAVTGAQAGLEHLLLGFRCPYG